MSCLPVQYCQVGAEEEHLKAASQFLQPSLEALHNKFTNTAYFLSLQIGLLLSCAQQFVLERSEQEALEDPRQITLNNEERC